MVIPLEINALKAVSEEIRLRILVLLLDRELCVCDLMDILNLPQSSISRHLSRLKSAGLVDDRRAGKWVFYRRAEINDPFLNNLISGLNGLKEKEPYKNDNERLSYHTKSKNCEVNLGE